MKTAVEMKTSCVHNSHAIICVYRNSHHMCIIVVHIFVAQNFKKSFGPLAISGLL